MGHYTFTDFLVSRWEVAQQVLAVLAGVGGAGGFSSAGFCSSLFDIVSTSTGL
jgi:hypothetical protein